jgi:transposase
MNYRYFVGVDISKETLDFTVLEQDQFLLHRKICNSNSEIKSFLKELMSEYRIGGTKSIFCFESTGCYMNFLIQELTGRKGHIWCVSALHLKRTLGIQRGKNDSVDSLRIAQFAYLHQNEYYSWIAPRGIINELKVLRSLRLRLQKVHQKLKNPLTDNAFFKPDLVKSLKSNCEKSIEAVKEDLKATDEAIQKLITEDGSLFSLYKLVTSVDGIGPVVALEMIIITNEFKRFDSAKKFCCYAGVAPFEHLSGTSVKGRTRISPICNRRMKALLTLAARSAVLMKGELRDYYNRRIKEGIPEQSVVNIIRNKLVHRVFASVKYQRMYTQKPPAIC